MTSDPKYNVKLNKVYIEISLMHFYCWRDSLYILK